MISLKSNKNVLLGCFLSVFFAVFLIGIPFSDALSPTELYWQDTQANGGEPVYQFDIVEADNPSFLNSGVSVHVEIPDNWCTQQDISNCRFQGYIMDGSIVGVDTKVVRYGTTIGGTGSCTPYDGSALNCTFSLDASGSGDFSDLQNGDLIWLVVAEISGLQQGIEFINFLQSEGECPSLCNFVAHNYYWQSVPEGIEGQGEFAPVNISRTMLGNPSFDWHIVYVSGSNPYELEIEYKYYNDLGDNWTQTGVLAQTGSIETGLTQFLFSVGAQVSDFSSDYKTATISATGITGEEWCFSASLLNGSDFSSSHTPWQPQGGLCIDVSASTNESEEGFTGFTGVEYKECDLTHFGGCLINAGIYLFVPEEITIQKWAQIKGSLANSFPFVYIFDIVSTYTNLQANNTASFEISIDTGITGFDEDIVLFTSASFGDTTFMDSGTWTTLRFLMGVAVYIGFVFFVFHSVKGLTHKI